jgi:hypothetical protein
MPHLEIKWIKSLSEEKTAEKDVCQSNEKVIKTNVCWQTGRRCKKGAKDIWSLVHAKSQIGRRRRKKANTSKCKNTFPIQF